jgi:hypothetical protein
VALLLVTGALAYGLCFNWNLEYRKEEWRAAARYVAKHARPGDAILCHPDYARIPFQYYFRGAQPVFAPFGGPVGEASDVAATLEGLASYDTVWLVQSHTEWVDPRRVVEGWLAGEFPVVTEQYPPGVEVKGYATTYRLSEAPSSARAVDAVYDGQVRLVAYWLLDRAYAATDDTYHPPSGWIHVTLYWEALAQLSEDYVAEVRLTDEAHQVWGGSLERATGAIRFYPPHDWQPGEIIRDDYDVNLNPRTPAGEYWLEVILRSTSGEELTATYQGGQSTAIPLSQVTVVSH